MPDNPDYVLTDVSHLEGETSETVYIRIDHIINLIWQENAKKHSLDSIWQSIAQYGFRDKAALDNSLTNVSGTTPSLIYGNGRVEALHHGWQAWKRGEHEAIPKGVKYDGDFWYVPVEIGLDARSVAQAQDFGIAHNTLTMLGGDFQDGDIWNMYDKEKLAELSKAMITDSEKEGFTPVSMDNEEVNDLLHFLGDEKIREDENMYSRKVEAPIYEPSREKPQISDLYDDTRTKRLVSDIQANDELSQDEKDFLIIAAQRHSVLNFSNIADYYAHSSPAVQKLMEDSALVIIDFDRAIELGFVKLSHDIKELDRGIDDE